MEYLYYKEEKLKYVIKKLNLSNKEISEKLEINRTMVANIQSYHQDRLRKHHLYAICSAYNIPIEIFENKNIKTKEHIDEILNNRYSMFHKNYELLEKLKGEWYLYSYPSNLAFADVWETKTTIYEDFSVEDMHKNRGKLFIGKKQSIIIKESHNSKNFTSITFDNDKVTYENFVFSRVSKSNSLNQELFNFGFFSRKKMDRERAKKVLGELEKVQLLMDFDMLRRVSYCIEIEG